MNSSGIQTYPEEKVQKWLEEIKPCMYRLFDSWYVRRLEDYTIDSYLKQAKKHVQDLMEEMVSESEERNQILVKEIKQVMEMLDTLSKELGKKVDLSSYQELPLDLVREKLNEEMEKLLACKEDLLNKYKQLRYKEYEICKKTGTKAIHFDKKLLSESDLEKFASYLDIQEAEKCRLQNEFMEIRTRILGMMRNLQLSTTGEFQKLVYNEPEKVVYTKENMALLHEWENHLKARIERFEKQVEEKRNEVFKLWKFLGESPAYCQQFLKDHSAVNPSTSRAFENEIKRCQDKRAENIAIYVKKIREEIVRLWDLCKFSAMQRNSFQLVHCQNYTESLLSLHEVEVKRLTEFYEENKKIFDLVAEFESIIEEMKVLDRRATNPDRLNNRGGQLLAEEKKRKAANKKLPKIQEQIMSKLENYAKTHTEPFTLDGLDAEEYFDKVWDEYTKEKENVKSEVRKQAKDKSMRKTPQSGSKIVPHSLSVKQANQTKTVKRKLLNESSASSQNVKAGNSSQSKQKKAPHFLVKRSRCNVRKSLNQSKKSRKNNSRRDSDDSIDTSYQEFQEHLQLHDDLRSSCIPNQLFQGLGETHRMKTPVKTPLKPRKLLTQMDLSVKKARPMGSSTPTTRPVTPTSRSPRGKIQLSVPPGNMPIFM